MRLCSYIGKSFNISVIGILEGKERDCDNMNI